MSDTTDWATALAWAGIALAIGAAVGALVHVLVARSLRRYGEPRGLRWPAAAVAALRGVPEVWGALAGAAIADPRASLSQEWSVWLERAWIVVLVVSVTVFLTRLAGALTMALVASDRSRLPTVSIVLNIVRFTIWVIGFVVALNLLGVEIGPLLTALGVTGIAISLGLQDILRNLFTGLQITLTHQYEPGQFVHLQSGEEGEVIDVTWRETRLHTPTGDIAVVPNSVIGNTVVTNYSRGDELYILDVEFRVVIEADLDRVLAVAVEVARDTARESPEVDTGFSPTCDVTSLADAGATCVTRLGVTHYRRRRIAQDAYLRGLHKRLQVEGIALS
ncbi:MAG TPA: mechanosensitive ion channel family protein [Thermoleophilia bacterium]|nr:mechanosensitive ion channel family protein [Thermoleophilia bacterium]